MCYGTLSDPLFLINVTFWHGCPSRGKHLFSIHKINQGHLLIENSFMTFVSAEFPRAYVELKQKVLYMDNTFAFKAL